MTGNTNQVNGSCTEIKTFQEKTGSLQKGLLLSTSYNSVFSGVPDKRRTKLHMATSWICSLVAEDELGL